MRSAIIGLVVGVGWLQCQASLPSLFILFLLFVAAASLLTCLGRVKQWLARVILLGISGALLGFVWAALLAHLYLGQELPLSLEGQDITVVGTVDSMPDYASGGVRFNFQIEKVLGQDGLEVASAIPSSIALSWYAKARSDQMGNSASRSSVGAHTGSKVNPATGNALAALPQVHPGERWRLTVRLHRPHGNANPFGFDYEAWLLEQNIRATGYVRDVNRNAADTSLLNQRLQDFVPGFGNAIDRSREWLRTRIQASLPGKPYAGVIVALVVGDQHAIGENDWVVFKRTGISHLMSISGLHITMIAAMFAWLAMALWRRSFFTRTSLPLRLPAQKAAAIAGVAAALIYVLLAGAGVPAQRTLCMLTVVAIALWCGRLTQVSHVLCIALGVVLIFDPWAVLMPGFWLSFAAVALILYVSVDTSQTMHDATTSGSRWQKTLMAGIATATRTQYAITLGLVPLTILLFAQTSLVSPVANAIAIPLVSFLVTPAALLGSAVPAPLSVWLLTAVHFLIAELMQFLQWLSALPLAVWIAPVPPWWMFALAMIGLLWMLAPRGWPARYLGGFLWLPLIMNVPSHPTADEMWVTAFDVGQGMAVLVETKQHRLLYDTGPAYSTQADAGKRIILPYLRARGIDQLDLMMISHSDNDHAGGALSVLHEMKVANVLSSLPEANPIMRAAQKSMPCRAGQSWQWNDAHFETLHPLADLDDGVKPNARSCVLKITMGQHAILLPGDIEAAQEAALVQADAATLRADVLLAPHHGSGTSSTLSFLQAVNPRIAIFQVGYRNRYHHPKPQVFDRYGEMGVQRVRSDIDGAVTLRFASGIVMQTYRAEHARYWYGR